MRNNASTVEGMASTVIAKCVRAAGLAIAIPRAAQKGPEKVTRFGTGKASNPGVREERVMGKAKRESRRRCWRRGEVPKIFSKRVRLSCMSPKPSENPIVNEVSLAAACSGRGIPSIVVENVCNMGRNESMLKTLGPSACKMGKWMHILVTINVDGPGARGEGKDIEKGNRSGAVVKRLVSKVSCLRFGRFRNT